jgi:molecular chaperone DnaK (HSP70)
VLTAERVKRELTTSTTATARISHDGRELDVPVTRAEFERLTSGLLDRTVELTRQAVRAARERGVGRVDRLLLVGGSSRMPAVAARLAKEIGVSAELTDPDLIVAKGAAVYGEKKAIERLVAGDLVTRGLLEDGAPLAGAAEADVDAACARLAGAMGLSKERVRRTVEVQVLNVCSRGFGVLALNQFGEPEAVFLVHRNDRLPAVVRRSFGTVMDDQDTDHDPGRRAGRGRREPAHRGQQDHRRGVDRRDPARLPRRDRAADHLSMGFDGILELTATHEGMAGRPLRVQVETSAALSQADVARERNQVAKVRRRDRG